MSKVKGAEEEQWKLAIDPLTLANLRVEKGEPHLSSKHSTYKNLMFLSTGLMLLIDTANCLS